MTQPRIVGIVLVRNEDLHLERVLRNIAAFCDVIHVADHQSTDATPEILTAMQREFPHLQVKRIDDPRESSQMLEPYVSTPTWVFGVDGDEIYDPAGLAKLRQQLLAGKYDQWWVFFGNVLNCDELDLTQGKASGYLAPPCRSMTKLYNFRMLRQIDPEARQRLHSRRGGDVFHEGYHALLRYELYKETTWEEAHFRCLHTCFLPRSSMEKQAGPRENVSESLRRWRRLSSMLLRAIGRQPQSDYKREKYMRGPRVTVDATPFFQ